MDLKALAEKALRTAKREGASQAEVFATSSRTLSVYIDDGHIKNVEEKVDQGIGMRVFKGRKIGQASSTCVSEQDAERCARSAARMSDLAPPSKSFDRLPSPASATLRPGNFDPLVNGLEPRALGELAKDVVAAATARGVKVPRGMVRAAAVDTLVLNSNGVEAPNRYTLVFADFGSMTDGASPGEGVRGYSSPWLEGLDPVCVGAALAEQATDAEAARGVKEPMKLPVMICPAELGHILGEIVASAASADSVQKRRSPWVGKMGESVASPELTVTDDPSDPRAVLSAPYDDEGVPTTTKPIIEGGVLKTFLYDAFSSSVEKRAPNGNGVRRGATNSQFVFRNPAGCSPFNLVVKPGAKGREEFLASFDRAVVVERFSNPDVNPITGALAIEVRLGKVLHKGSVEATFKHALLVGNMYEAIRRVEGVGRDIEVVGPVILPTIAFDGLELVGSG